MSPTQLAREAPLFIDGEWIDGRSVEDVLDPYTGQPVGRMHVADAAHVAHAVAIASEAHRGLAIAPHERAEILLRTAALIVDRADELAHVITLETGKPIKQSRLEVSRASQTFRLSGVEAVKLTGHTVPMAATANGVGKVGFTLTVPVGPVVAITPFNFPLNLAAHKVGPAIAAGNPVILKPATATPLSSAFLVELLIEAGLPANYIALLSGPGVEVGEALVTHEDVAAISFTGSCDVGWAIRRLAPGKRVFLELGSTAPLIIDESGDWATAAAKAAVHGNSFAGQSCISVQRILVHEALESRFRERLVEEIARQRVGSPLDDDTDVGPLIDEANRERVLDWIAEAVQGGGRLVAGGTVNADGTLNPTIIDDPDRASHAWSDEIFGPVVSLRTVESLDQAIAEANESRFGLQAGVFTRDLAHALQAAHKLEFGGVLINEVPTFRADQQPYGGVKDSGNTREGPAYTIRELSEERFVSFQE